MQSISLSEPKQNKFGENYYQEINNLTFEKQSSDVVFNNYYSELLESEEFLFIIVGTDSGLLYNFIKEREKELKGDVKFIFIDFDNVNQATGLVGDSSEVWEGDVRLVKQDFKFGRISQDFRNYVIRRKITLIKSLAVLDAQPGSPYFKLWDDCEVAFTGFRRSEYNALSTKVFEEERILNAADNVVPARLLVDAIEGKDVVLLGGGPTLDDAIDWIKDNQEKLIIFAAARIANRLAREGITADFFVTVDPFDWSFDNSKGVLAFSEESILIHSFHAQHKIVSQWRGLSAYAGLRFGWRTDEQPNIDTPGPTVTNAALHMACSIGASRVFLSGIDFCFAKGLSHESGSAEAKMSDTFGYQNKAKLEDYQGNMTETSDDFYSAFFSMQAAIKSYKAAKNLEFYSLGLHSAKLEGVPFISCDEVVLKSFDKSDLMLSIKDKLTVSNQQRKEFALTTVKELKDQLKRFQALKKISDQGLIASGKIFDPITNEPKTKAMTKVQRLRKKADANVGDDGDMLMNYQATFFSDSFKAVEDESAMEKDEIVEQLTSFFGGLQKVSEHFIKTIKKGVERAQLRADELSPGSLPSKLFKGWEAFHEFGRAQQWVDWHDETLPESEQSSLDLALANFKDEYEKQDHFYSTMVQKKVSNVSTLLARANQAYNNKNVAELEGLIKHSEGLESEDKGQKESFLNLLKAMLSELKEDFDNAVDFYLKVEMPFLRHQGFKKLLNFYMSNGMHHEALVVLEQLCTFSLDYMVPYADMLGLLGNADSAAQVLEMYLSQNPENLQVQNKYAQLLIEIGQTDKAWPVINAVLEQDSLNKTALFLQQQLEQA